MGSLVSKKKQSPSGEQRDSSAATPSAADKSDPTPATPPAAAEGDVKDNDAPPAEGSESGGKGDAPAAVPEVKIDEAPSHEGGADEVKVDDETAVTVVGTPVAVALKCAVQQYAWGRIGKDSEVATLTESSDPSFQLKEDEPYAELWMGTHTKGPSMVAGDEAKSLKDWIQSQPDCLGNKVRSKFNDQLPFLFKVLSVNKSLSIQAHPHKALAETLHAEHPENYPDDNHKPEMAIALTPFEGLNGFRPLIEIDEFLKTVPEFRVVVGEDNAAKFTAELESGGNDGKSVLKECFTGLMTRDPEIIKEQLGLLVQRLEAEESETSKNRELLLRLNSQFAGDVGCFCSFFMNHITLQPGEAMFLGPNEPHAYLCGNCMECMACSDNVVRAGLTPKYKDVENLCKMLTYIPGTPQERLFPSVTDPQDPCVTVYDPPIPDFAVARIQVAEGVESYEVTAYDSASILITITGQAEVSHPSFENGKTLNLKRGTVIFISANHSLPLKIEKSGGLLAFRAYCPLA